MIKAVLVQIEPRPQTALGLPLPGAWDLCARNSKAHRRVSLLLLQDAWALAALSSAATGPVPSHPHSHLLSFVFLVTVVMTGLRLNLKVGLICISLMVEDVEHLKKIAIPSFKNCLLSSLAYLLIGYGDDGSGGGCIRV